MTPQDFSEAYSEQHLCGASEDRSLLSPFRELPLAQRPLAPLFCPPHLCMQGSQQPMRAILVLLHSLEPRSTDDDLYSRCTSSHHLDATDDNLFSTNDDLYSRCASSNHLDALSSTSTPSCVQCSAFGCCIT